MPATTVGKKAKLLICQPFFHVSSSGYVANFCIIMAVLLQLNFLRILHNHNYWHCTAYFQLVGLGGLTESFSSWCSVCPAAVYVSDTSNYCHKANKQKIWSCMLRGSRSAKEILYLYLFPLSWNQRALEKHSRFTINLWKQSLVDTENNLYLWMYLCEPTLCKLYCKLV